jgi:dephospho-CoA kinase
MTLKMGITGGIGSGKSLACELFAMMGVPVYNADARAKELMVESQELAGAIKARFGRSVYDEQGRLNRRVLADRVFGDEDALKALNALVHPVVFEDAELWFKRQTAPYALKEAALIYESGADRWLDGVIVVTAPVRLRLKRVHRRDDHSYEEIRQRIERQWSDREKLKKADYVIRNNEQRSLVEQVWSVHQRILATIEQRNNT